MTPVGSLTRPTSDRVREALFSRLESRYGLVDRHVLDLYAGSGALGIEAMSRGAASLISVEASGTAAAVIERNIRSCGLDGSAEVIVLNVAEALERFEAESRRFDAVFMDPPYGDVAVLAVLETAGRSMLMNEEAFLVLESSARQAMPPVAGRLERAREDVYGDTKLTLYENRAGREDE